MRGLDAGPPVRLTRVNGGDLLGLPTSLSSFNGISSITGSNRAQDTHVDPAEEARLM